MRTPHYSVKQTVFSVPLVFGPYKICSIMRMVVCLSHKIVHHIWWNQQLDIIIAQIVQTSGSFPASVQQGRAEVGTLLNSGHLLERFHCTHSCVPHICGYYLRAEFILLGAPDCADTLQMWWLFKGGDYSRAASNRRSLGQRSSLLCQKWVFFPNGVWDLF